MTAPELGGSSLGQLILAVSREDSGSGEDCVPQPGMFRNGSISRRVVNGLEDMSRIDIDALSEEELIELNHKVVARLRFLREMRSHAEMLDFRIGERVAFRPPGRTELTGVITRYNKKTVTVITDDGQHWNVAPSLLM